MARQISIKDKIFLSLNAIRKEYNCSYSDAIERYQSKDIVSKNKLDAIIKIINEEQKN